MASLIHQGSRYYLQFFDSSRYPKRKRVSLKTANRRLAAEVTGTLEARYVLGEYDPWASVSMKVETIGDAYAAFMGRKKNLRASTWHCVSVDRRRTIWVSA